MSERLKKSPAEMAERKAETTRIWKEKNKDAYLAQQAEERRRFRSLLPSEGRALIQQFLGGSAFAAIHEMRDEAETFETISDILEELLRDPVEADRMVREAIEAERAKAASTGATETKATA